MTLSVSVSEKEPGVLTLTPIGSIDAATYPTLENELNAAVGRSPRVVVLEMDGVGYISSAGIRVILKGKKALSEQGGSLVMLNLQPKVKRVFDIIKALPSQQVFASMEELDSYLDKIQRGV